MANLKLTSTETISVAGKRVSNTKSHNIPGINNVYQETVKLNKRPSSYTYLHVAEVPSASYDDKPIYIEAHTHRKFTFSGDGTGSSTTVEMDAAVAAYVLASVASNTTELAPDLRLVGDIIPTGDTNDDGADDRIISITDDDTFVIAANTASASNQKVTAYGNQFSADATMVSGKKYIVHSFVPASSIKVGMRVTGTSIGTNAVVSRIVNNTEFEVDVASTGGTSNFISFSDTIKITFDDDVTQANSTKHIAGVSGIFGAEDNLTNRKSVLTSLKKSLDLWVSAGAPFSVGGITDNGTLPYLKITHIDPGPSEGTRELYGNMIKADQLFSATRPGEALAQKSNTFKDTSISTVELVTLVDSVSGQTTVSRSSGASFANDDVKYIRLTNNGSTNSFIFLKIDSYDLRSAFRGSTKVQTTETASGVTQEGDIYNINGFITKKLKPGESMSLYEATIDVSYSFSNAPRLTEIDSIHGLSESATVNGSIEVFVASK
tara:strand:- start:3272 stop:4747 length:1476 start_codon:yes stop_codon:yes gene_type:complete